MRIASVRHIILLLPALMKRGHGLGHEIETVQRGRELFYVNPCTGSISRDEPDENDLPCLTRSPTVSPSPMPSLIPTEDQGIIEKYQCPGEDCNFDFTSEENVVKVEYYYSVETPADVEDPSSQLEKLEEKLLASLASPILGHCIDDGDIRMLQTNNDPELPFQRRHLTSRRRLAPTGICSDPSDEYVSSETCTPENESNKCFVIKGGVSVSIEDGDSEEKVRQDVLAAVEDAMDNDKLLSDDQPEIEKVTFIGEVDEPGTVPGVAAITEPEEEKDRDIAGIVVGTCFAALAALLLIIFVRRRREEEEDDASLNPFGLTAFPGVSDGSFVAADRDDICKRASAMDVHHCKSQTCEKCYKNGRLNVVKTPLNQSGEFARDNIDYQPSTIASESSDSNSVQTYNFFC